MIEFWNDEDVVWVDARGSEGNPPPLVGDGGSNSRPTPSERLEDILDMMDRAGEPEPEEEPEPEVDANGPTARGDDWIPLVVGGLAGATALAAGLTLVVGIGVLATGGR